MDIKLMIKINIMNLKHILAILDCKNKKRRDLSK